MSAEDQLLPQFVVIVDFAVKDDGHLTVLVPHRLFTGGEVEDRQSAMAEINSSIVIDVKAVTIGPPVC